MFQMLLLFPKNLKIFLLKICLIQKKRNWMNHLKKNEEIIIEIDNDKEIEDLNLMEK